MPALGKALGLPFTRQDTEGFAPYYSDIVWYAKYGVESGTDNTINDIKSPLVITDKAKYVGNNAVYFDGTTYASVPAVIDISTLTFTFEGYRNTSVSGNNETFISSYSPGDNNRSFLIGKTSGGDLRCITSADGGSSVLISTVTAVNVPSGNNKIKLIRVGTSITWYINDVLVPSTGGSVASIHFSPAPILISAIYSNYTTTPTATLDRYTGIGYADKFSVNGQNLICYEWSEGAGLTGHNHLMADYNATLQGSSNPSDFWGVVTQDNRAANQLFGFSLYEHATLDPLRILFIDGQPNPSPVIPSGYTLTDHFPPNDFHNRSESKVIQTDDYFISGTINTFSLDGTTQKSISFEDLENHVNGAYNFYIKFNAEGVAEYGVQYALDKGWSESELLRLTTFFGDTPNGGHVVIARDEDGNALYDEAGNVIYINP